MSDLIVGQHNNLADAELQKLTLGRHLWDVRISESPSGYGYNVIVNREEYIKKFGEPKTNIQP